MITAHNNKILLTFFLIVIILSCKKEYKEPEGNTKTPDDQETDTITESNEPIDSTELIYYFTDSLILSDNSEFDINGDNIYDAKVDYESYFVSGGDCEGCEDKTYNIVSLYLKNNFYAQGLSCRGNYSPRFLLQNNTDFKYDSLNCLLDNAYFSFIINVGRSHIVPDSYWVENTVGYLPVKEIKDGKCKYGYIELAVDSLEKKYVLLSIKMTRFFVKMED